MTGVKRSMSILDRLSEKSVTARNGCVEWVGYTLDGYGKMRVGEKRQSTHRLSYEHNIGPIPDGMCVCHKCDNRKCINPGHLFLGTRGDNNLDKTRKGRQARGGCHGLRGDEHPRAKLSSAEVSAIRELLRAGTAQSRIAKKFNVSQSAISQINTMKRWAA